MRLFLGIDGGQSSTTALIGDEAGRVLGEGRAGPCNHVGEAERRAKFTAAVGDSVREAAKQAGVGLEEPFAAVCAGFSGGAADKTALTRELIRAARYHITDDAQIALAGAANGGPGIIVIAGTGSIAYGRNAAKQTARAGGWGYVFGDEGSAFDLVRQALRAALRYEEGWGPPTALHAFLMTQTGLTATANASANTLLHQFYTAEYPRERIAALAPLVDEAARSGDAVAGALIEHAAQELALLSAAVRRQLFQEPDEAPVHYIGGVFECETLLARFRLLTELDEISRVSPPRHPPAYGALLEAIRLG
jgi:N-acetylglucosamine kinase-like BadF-type ATPase